MNAPQFFFARYILFILFFSFTTFFLVLVTNSESTSNSGKLEAEYSYSELLHGNQSIEDHYDNIDRNKLDSLSLSDSNKESLYTHVGSKLTGAIRQSFIEFQKGKLSRSDIDIEELILDVVKLALDGNGNRVLPSLELIDFFQKIIETSKYNTVTTLDYILAFISKDKFDTSITHDIKRLRNFTEYLSHLLNYNNFGQNKVLNSGKETLSLIKTRIHSSIWGMEELIRTDKILDYEIQNLGGKTIYSSQPVIGEVTNEINSNQPRAVFSYKLVKQTIIEMLGTNINKVCSKLKRIYGKITYLGSTKSNKLISLNLLYSIYLSVIMINDLHSQGLSSNVLSPGFIFIVLLRDDIEHLPNNWEERLIDHNIKYGINELDIKIQDSKYPNSETIITKGYTNNECNVSVLKNNIQAVFGKYGIDYFKFMNEALKKYKTFFVPSMNGQININSWFNNYSVNWDFTDKSNKNWFFDVNELVIEAGVTRAIDFMDEYHSLEISLSKSGLSSAIVVGESKLLKRTLVEYLANRIINGNSSMYLRGYRIISIDLDSLLESCKNTKKSLTEQIKIKFDELLGTYDDKVIVFTDHFFSSFETPTGSKRLYDIMKHYIIRGTLKVIAALSGESYRILAEKESEVKSIFQEIKMKELSGIVSELFISGLRYQLELSTGIFINNDVIQTSVLMCNKYIKNCVLPDGAVELINFAISMAKNEQFLEIPSAIYGIEDFISHSRIGVQASKIRDYESNSIISLNRSRLLEILKMHIKMKNNIISLALKIRPYLIKFRYLKTQLYLMMLLNVNFQMLCVKKPLEDEFKLLENREKIIPNFSDELSVTQLTNIYRKNLLKYKQTNNKSYNESINDEISAITESQLDPKFFEDIHPVVKDKQKEVADMKSLILEMAFNYNSFYSPLGMGEIDASHIAFIVSERYGKSMSKLLDEIEYRKLPEKMKDRISEILSKYIIGQKSAIDYVSFHLGVELLKDNKNNPRCLLFVGPSGSGKKTFALALQTTLIESSMLFYDFSYDIRMYSHFKTLKSSEFADADAAKRLLGDNPGTGIISEELKQSGKTAFLFENIENMHPDVIKLVLDILRNKDNINQKIGNLGMSTFILTTKVGSEIILKSPDQIDTIKIRIDVIKKLRETFNSDLVRVIQNVVLFRPFTKEEAVKVLEINFSEFSAFIKKNYNATFIQPSLLVLNKIVDVKYSPELGYKSVLDCFEREVKEKALQLIKKGVLRPYTAFKITIRDSSSVEDPSEFKIDFAIVKKSIYSR
ncbi:ATP-dependent Clp Aec27 ATP-binding chain [Cryptosporidium sp. chipmunk genotype I]|uniref:ATP-dependent Clp Aec27 ATP-binding chain n=1 Tax=Cryptosporidium sp. chipmunk genotype I TaxID=1280935 RepID=UPI003519E0DD|nr:ATP-dependent Clp Aec27 ATP-binding chain [Cryptosporidium sp. chipmunk genotype I]